MRHAGSTEVASGVARAAVGDLSGRSEPPAESDRDLATDGRQRPEWSDRVSWRTISVVFVSGNFVSGNFESGHDTTSVLWVAQTNSAISVGNGTAEQLEW